MVRQRYGRNDRLFVSAWRVMLILAAWVCAAAGLACAQPTSHAVTTSAPSGQVTITEEPYMGRPAIVLDTGVARVAILPKEGGRVIECALDKTGRNHFFVDRKQMESAGKAKLAGGLADLVGEQGCIMWPGDFFDAEYDAKTERQADRASVTVGARKGIVAIERTVTVYPGEARLDVRTTYTNLGQTPANLLVRMNTVWNVGGGSAGDDYAFFPMPDGLGRARCVATPEMPFSEYYQSMSGWWFAVDEKTREVLVCTYRPEEVQALLRWGGDTSYTFELMGRKTCVPPAGTVSVQCSYNLLAAPEDLAGMRCPLLSAEEAKALQGHVGRFYRDFQQLLRTSLGREDRIRQLARALASGKGPAPGERGLLFRVRRSNLDGTYQPFAMFVPDSYAPDRPTPLLLVLHGADATETSELLATDLLAQARRRGYILASPYTRGQTGVWGLGEEDAMGLLDLVRRDYNIDPQRIFVTGVSMGGFGTWQLGMCHPDLFAGIAPIVGTNPNERAMNLRHVPAYIIAGARDKAVPVEGARKMHAALRELGYDVTYREFPQYGHGAFVTDLDELFDWMDRRRRVTDPAIVSYRTDTGGHNRAYWVSVEEMLDYRKPGTITAQLQPGNRLVLDLDNVGRVELRPPAGLFDATKPLGITINGIPALAERVADGGKLTLFAATDGDQIKGWSTVDPSPAKLRKTPAVSGPIWRARGAAFVGVYGTAGTEEATRINREAAERAADFGPMRFFKAPVKADKDVSNQDIRTRNLLLFGNAASNSLLARIEKDLPIRIEGKAVVLDKQRFEGDDVGYCLIYPNPLNPQRLVMVNAGLTPAAINDIPDFHVTYDYVVFDGKSKKPPEGQEPAPLAIGCFDRFWRVAAASK